MVRHVILPWQEHSDEFFGILEQSAVAGGELKRGDTVVMVSGSTKLRGADYVMKIITVP